jgi:hypothetical protein
MIVEIYNNEPIEEEKRVRLALEDLGDGEVALVTKDEKGETEWYLISVKNDGTFYRHEGLEDSGLPVDKNGRLKEVK